jgi:putative nucleotidyltransferase with HDIG domain
MLRTRLIAGPASGFVLSAVVATALTVLSFGEALFEPWRIDPNVPAMVTLRLPRTTLQTYDAGSGRHAATTAPIVARGKVVDDPVLAQQVVAYEQSRRPPRLATLAAHFTVYFLTVLMMTGYLRYGHARQGGLLRTQIGLLVLALVFLISHKAFLLLSGLPALLTPVAVVPLWASLYLDRRTGMLMGSVLTVLASSLVSWDPITFVTYLVSCAVAATAVAPRKVGQLLPTGLFAGFAAMLAYVATKEALDGFSVEAEMNAGLVSPAGAALLGGILSGVIAYVLRPLIARLLGVLSRGQLTNLTDLDQPLLRKMANEAPGSWEHSRAMANLAEAAAAAIHADALLTRTGAYYHDLGKCCQARYFVENLPPGERSPHEELDPDVSADAIMAHVIEGVRVLREGGVPEPVVEFAYTHHGTSVIEYFWHKCLRLGNPKKLSEESFRYPGMKPRTKETAILMLVDSIEAGARTVDPPSREGFEKLVERVMFSKMKQGQLDDAGLSLEEMRVLANRLVDTLCNVYHSRIRYPWQDEEQKRQEQALARDVAAPAPSAPDGNGNEDRISDERPRVSTPPGIDTRAAAERVPKV